MKTSKHILGPWEVGEVKEFLLDCKSQEIIAEDGKIGLAYGTTDEDCKANAELMAAAPEMLELLRELYDFRLHLSVILKPEQHKKALKETKALLDRLD